VIRDLRNPLEQDGPLELGEAAEPGTEPAPDAIDEEEPREA
jgi:hypothetical protein